MYVRGLLLLFRLKPPERAPSVSQKIFPKTLPPPPPGLLLEAGVGKENTATWPERDPPVTRSCRCREGVFFFAVVLVG